MIARPKRSTTTSLHTYGERSRMETAHAIFGAVVAVFGVAAFVTFYDEFKPGTQTSLCLPGRGPLPHLEGRNRTRKNCHKMIAHAGGRPVCVPHRA